MPNVTQTLIQSPLQDGKMIAGEEIVLNLNMNHKVLPAGARCCLIEAIFQKLANLLSILLMKLKKCSTRSLFS